MPLALVEQSCTPCRGGMPPTTQEEAAGYRVQASDWELLDGAKRIERTYRFRNFREAFAFVERAAALAETEGHHPEITFGWGYATIPMHTKKIKGLHENEFIMAASSIGSLPSAQQRRTKLKPLPSASRGWAVPEHIGGAKNSLN